MKKRLRELILLFGLILMVTIWVGYSRAKAAGDGDTADSMSGSQMDVMCRQFWFHETFGSGSSVS